MSRFRPSQCVIRTPEGCSFPLQVAGPISRFLAWLIDSLCMFLAIYVALQLLAAFAMVSPDAALSLVILLIFAVLFGYGTLLESLWRGRTVGKKLLGLQVIDQHGLRLSFEQILVRNLLRAVDALPLLYVVGGLCSMLNVRGQRLGDMAAGTIVIRTARRASPRLPKALQNKYNSFRDHPHLELRLRQRVQPLEAHLALEALQRRDGLEPEARLTLFSDLARHFRQIVPFPVEIVESLSDEQYVANVVDSVFRKRARQS